ncbi:MAG: sigma-70 family RNA polymerase sigma factor [Phycisphaeraceae bacterium]|nr:sigma-70 family RNA polymerase sigma factor [Phycisphaeraceae bacterium]MCB9848769.1 sigma-70 family RNA polymerase sigma factor [Phycisphaeraceae bacterium]
MSGTRSIWPVYDLDPLTRRRIRYRADRLARVFNLTHEDREDLAHDLAAEVLRAMPRHDPERFPAAAFARGVMDHWYKHTARQLRSRRERGPVFVSLHGRSCQSSAFEDRRSSHVASADLRMDLEPLLRALPRELGELAEQLKSKSVAEIADERGVHRGTVYRHVKQLRELLAPAQSLLC